MLIFIYVDLASFQTRDKENGPGATAEAPSHKPRSAAEVKSKPGVVQETDSHQASVLPIVAAPESCS